MSEPLGIPRTHDTRQSFLEQLAHTSHEVEALHHHLDLIPNEVLVGRPLDSDYSFKEIYALLALFDERFYGPVVGRIASQEEVRIEAPDERVLLAETAWNDLDMREIIDRFRSERSRLLKDLNDLPINLWQEDLTVGEERTDLFGFVYSIIHRDASLLRTAAYRLHESRLTSREEDLPK